MFERFLVEKSGSEEMSEKRERRIRDSSCGFDRSLENRNPDRSISIIEDQMSGGQHA